MEKQVIPITLMRKRIADTVTSSKQNIPHFYVSIDVNMSKVLELQENWKNEDGCRPSVNHFILKATSMALIEFPELNVIYSPEGIIMHQSVNIGFAMAMEGGMIIPVIGNSEKLSLQEISECARELVAKAKGKKLLPKDYTGATFTVSNMGMMNIKSFAAIIPPPQAAILAVGMIDTVPRWNGSTWEPASVSTMVLSIDHRVADGALAARFLNKLRTLLENPDDLL